MYTSADDTRESSSVCVCVLFPHCLPASLHASVCIVCVCKNYHNSTALLSQANCSAVVKQLIKVYKPNRRHGMCLFSCSFPPSRFFFYRGPGFLKYQESYCHQNVKHFNMCIVR